jgi:poly-gamma-glutamate capsule biosynthesis protein CapA/YwtB (metallophosphatase superfamily)
MDSRSPEVSLFLCGDVMLGRGIDQILPHPGDPRLHEPHVSSARAYVKLAERANGPIPKPVDAAYVWGDALALLRGTPPDLRIVNLETSITKSCEFVPKGINYKMNPENIACLTAARIDCCVLANNHVLDWGVAGLLETLDTLHAAGIRAAGAGRNAEAAAAPAVFELPGGGRVLVFAFGMETSGIPRSWAAAPAKPGVNLLADTSPRTVAGIAEHVAATVRPGDVPVASIHWGGNWGYEIPNAERLFAHDLIDRAGFAIVHGHSSHHAKAIEIYRGRLILYGCGDFLTDYEGIAGYESYRGDLAPMYLPRLAPSDGRLLALRIVPFRLRNFRLGRASRQDALWLHNTLARESARYGARLRLDENDHLSIAW